jgi:D-aminopeptidase
MQTGPRNAITDIAGLRVGNADDHALKSGSTVLLGDAPFTASVHVMGGAPGTRETDLLAPDKSVAQVDALVLSGGSAFGLDAASGVMDGLRAIGRGFAIGPALVPLVPAAIIFDLVNGGDKDWTDNPYRALGWAALDNATADFAIGTVGAGTGAVAGDFKGGLGTASCILPDGSTVGALVITNPIGHVATRDGRLWAAPFEMEDEFGGLTPTAVTGQATAHNSRKVAAMMAAVERANTTIAIVATDAGLTKAECQRMAIAAHDGIGRAIVPAHSPMDGDLVFGIATGAAGSDHDLAAVCHAAALCLTRAIGRSVTTATPAPRDLLPCWSG